MDPPHCNNSNNIIGPEYLHHSPHKYGCNGLTRGEFCPSDQGYDSCQSGLLLQNNSTCIQPSEHFSSHFNMARTPSNGLQNHQYHNPGSLDHMQNILQNGHVWPVSPNSYSGPRGSIKFSYSAEAPEQFQRTHNIQNGWRGTRSLDEMQSDVENGYSKGRSPMGYDARLGLMQFPCSGQVVGQNGRPLQALPRHHSMPNPGDSNMAHSDKKKEPTSTAPPPVIQKHSSFMRQNAIEEEDDDADRDELADSGFGSMRRTTSQDGPIRRSRSKDVSDAPADDLNNNLAPRVLRRSQSSQERTDNELAQFHCEQRRCSSEQVHRSNSSGYYSADSVQGTAAEDIFKLYDAAKAEVASEAAKATEGTIPAEAGTGAAVDLEDEVFHIQGLRDRLDSCQNPVWEQEVLYHEISSLRDLPLLAREAHKYLMREFSLEAFQLPELHIKEPSTTFSYSDVKRKEKLSQPHVLRSREEDLVEFIPDTSSQLMFSSDGSDRVSGVQQTNKHTDDVPQKVPPHPGDILDEETKMRLQTLLERHAYCVAMEHKTCNDPDCRKARLFQENLEKCYKKSTLDECQDCQESAKAYWKHSQACSSDRCVLPFCIYFKELFSCDQDLNFFDAAFGCLVKQKKIDVLQRLHELDQLQQPATHDQEVWSANATAERHLRNGEPDYSLTTVGSLSKFGLFTPIRCRAKRGEQQSRVVIKKIKCCKSLLTTMRKLHNDPPHLAEDCTPNTSPLLQDVIAACLWCRQIGAEKMLFCSTYLPEKSLSACLEFSRDSLEDYWKEACKAAVKLHEYGILYLNWKVDHIFMTPTDGVKLSNMDYAVDISPSSRELRGSCSEEWKGAAVPERVKTGLDPRIAPPEVLHGQGLMHESDSWGLGCLLYQLCHGGCLPFPHLSHLSDDEIRKRLRDGYMGPTFHETDPHTILNEMCFNNNPLGRQLPAMLVDKFGEHTANLVER